MKKIIYILVISMLMTGCWGKTELKDVGLVTAMGVDLEDDGTITMSVLMVVPLGTDVYKSKTWYGKANGKTLMDASKNIRRYTTKKPEWYHNSLVIIGEKLAKDNMHKVVDYLSRNQEIRYSTNLLVCEGRADKLLSSPADLDMDLASAINGLINNTDDYTKAYVENLKGFLQNVDSNTISSVCGRLTYEESDKVTFSTNRETRMSLNEGTPYRKISLDGMAIFNVTQLAGYFNPLETSGFLFITGKAKEGGLPVDLGNEEFVFLDHKAPSSNIDINFDDGELNVKIDVEVDTLIVETTRQLLMKDKNLIKEIELKAADEVKRRMKMAVSRAKEFDSDVFGISRAIHRKYPKQWAQLKHNWSSLFKRLPIEYSVKVNLKGFNLIGDRIDIKK